MNGNKITGLGAGTVSNTSTDAINGGQLSGTAASVASALGGGASVKTDGTVASPSYRVGGNTVGTVGDALTNLDGRTTSNTTSITNLTNGTVGIVQRNATTGNITVGAGFGDGAQVSIASSKASRKLTGVAAGTISSSSVDAVNGSQLQSTASTIASALGGNAAMSAAGAWTAPSYTVAGKTVNNVGAALSNLDAQSGVNATSITDLSNSIAGGTAGLVQQDAISRNITVGAATDGTKVDFNNKAKETRTLTGVAAGSVSDGSVDAINGSQLYGVASNVATALGGGAAIDATTGKWTAPSYLVGGTTVGSVAGAISNIDGRTAQNTTDIADNTSAIGNLSTAIANGSTGLVQQDATTRNITVGAATDGAQVSIASKTGTRVLTGVTAGAVSSQSVDAVNGAQLLGTATSVAAALGGNASVDSKGVVTAPSYSVGGAPVNNVGDALTNLDSRTGANAISITNLSNSITNGTTGLVQQVASTRNITVGAATDGVQVSIASKTGSRVLTGLTAGEVSSKSVDAVNGSQLFGTSSSVAAVLGGGASVDSKGGVSAPSYSVGGTSVGSVGDALANVDSRVIQNSSAIDSLNNGTAGLVQQDVATRNITVGAGTDGAQVSLASNAGTRVLTGVTAGEVSSKSVDAINGSQLSGLAGSVASALGGGAKVQGDGTVTAPSYAVGGGTVNSVDAAITNVDGRVTQNASDIKGNTNAIDNLSSAIANGSTGLVQQDAATRNITVGAATDGAQVSIASKTGTRVLTGVTAGEVSSKSVDAVNGGQLFGVAGSVANALGGGAKVQADGTVSAPSYAVGGNTFTSVEGAVGNLDGRIAQNTSGISANTSAINSLTSGAAGLVQQDATTRNISVGQSTDGSVVSFAGSSGNRTLTGVAAGNVSSTSVDAINGSQLYASVSSIAAALGGGAGVGATGALIPPSFTVGGTTVHNVGAAVTTLDGRVNSVAGSVTSITNQINSGSVGLVQQAGGSNAINVGAGTGGTTVNMSGTDGNRVVTGVANGNIGQGSTDAVNGGQIYGMQQQLGQVSATTTALSTDTTTSSGGSATPPATVKPGTSGVSLGNGATVQANNSAAIGANSVADRPNTVSVGSPGNERVIANVADPVIDTDAVNQRTLNNAVQSANNYTDQRVNQLQNAVGDTARKSYSGVAAATALTMIPEVDAGKTFALGIGASSYQGYGATAIGVSVRVNERVKIKAGTGFSSAGTTAGVGASFQW